MLLPACNQRDHGNMPEIPKPAVASHREDCNACGAEGSVRITSTIDVTSQGDGVPMALPSKGKCGAEQLLS